MYLSWIPVLLLEIIPMNKFTLIVILSALFVFQFNLNAQKSYSEKIFFKSDSFVLSSENQTKLKNIIVFLDTTIINKITITGYCDDQDSEEHNQVLSINRGKSVKNFMQTNSSLKESFFILKGNGELPLSDGKSIAEQRAENRRVEIEIDYALKPKEIIPQSKESIAIKPKTYESKLSDHQKVGDKIILENILFYGGRHVLLPESYDDLEILTSTLIEKKKYHIIILGHICCLHNGEDGIDYDTGIYNLSEARAQAIMLYLIEHGVDKKRLSYKGMKANYPLGKGDKYDRRVEIEITSIDPE